MREIDGIKNIPAWDTVHPGQRMRQAEELERSLYSEECLRKYFPDRRSEPRHKVEE